MNLSLFLTISLLFLLHTSIAQDILNSDKQRVNNLGERSPENIQTIPANKDSENNNKEEDQRNGSNDNTRRMDNNIQSSQYIENKEVNNDVNKNLDENKANVLSEEEAIQNISHATPTSPELLNESIEEEEISQVEKLNLDSLYLSKYLANNLLFVL